MVEQKIKVRILENKCIITGVLFTLLFVFGCYNRSKDSETLRSLKSIYVDTTNIIFSHPSGINTDNVTSKSELIIKPDTTINKKLFLENYSSLDQFYFAAGNLELIESLRESPVVIFTDRLNHQYLLAYQYEGDTKNAFACFEIGFFNKENFADYRYYQTNESKFTTESGIELNLPIDSLIAIKGTNYLLKGNKEKGTLFYNIENNSTFVDRYSMPGYFMKYEIENGVVKKILFGFEYP